LKNKKVRLSYTLIIIFIILFSTLLPTLSTAENIYPSRKGFETGVSYESVVPLKKVTFVNFEEDSILDDYSYLAALPTSVYYAEDKLFSHPLLYYQEQADFDDEKKITLDARKGIDYFMQDWMGYCQERLDKMTLINVDKSKVGLWNSREYETIQGNNPFDIAYDIALEDWSYTDNAVISVISEEFSDKKEVVENEIKGTLATCNVNTDDSFKLKQTNSLNPIFKEFRVGKNYVYIKAEAWWDGVLFAGIMIPTGDPDLQLYCYNEDIGDWMQTKAVSYWNIFRPAGHEYTHSHVYNSGDWKIAITDYPTESESDRRGIPGVLEIQGSLIDMLLTRGVSYNIDITKYPGEIIDLPDKPPFGCKSADFKLTWDNPSIDLGFTILGPSGEAIFTEINESSDDELEIHLENLGECLEDEHYSISIFSLNDIYKAIDYKIQYKWEQKLSKEKTQSLTSATEGAVLASLLNAPLLYTKNNELVTKTKQALYKLGVKNIHVVDIGNYLDSKTKNEIKDISDINYFNSLDEIYDYIAELSGQKDVIFSTVDPWSYWYLGELRAAGEYDGAHFLGPAAFCAAHHGSPVIIIENHPRLSSARVWHNEFWSRFTDDRYFYRPSTAEMFLTGSQIYDFLEEYGFDGNGKETIITIADQYEIGASWDRIFPGVGYSGRFCGTPVDTSYWIARNVFYPALIFENPGLQDKVTLENGSISTRNIGFKLGKLGDFFRRQGFFLQFGLADYEKIRDSGPEEFTNPVLCSFVTHKHRFNERASKYYGSTYECPTGLTPGFDSSHNSIDQGSISKYTDNSGSYFPDITETEIVPFYLEKGGYDVAFSTALEPVVNNLNQGVLLWIHGSHGTEPDGGGTLFWSPEEGLAENTGLVPGLLKLQKLLSDALGLPIFSPILNLLYYWWYVVSPLPGFLNEDNPWRGYDWYYGSTEEPDTMSQDYYGYIPYTSIRLPGFATGIDWVRARRVGREVINYLIPFFDPLEVEDLYDGVIGSVEHSRIPMKRYVATDIEENLDNLHSAGFITSICQTSNTYFHLMLIRHGSVFQVQDPWPTSWYGGVWRQSIPRDIILGYTVGQAYARGMEHVGILYLGGGGVDGEKPQWWWDDAENVVYFGDPMLRMYVPETKYSDANYWTEDEVFPLSFDKETCIEGHCPFEVTIYPNAYEEEGWFNQFMQILTLLVILLIVILIIGKIFLKKKKGGK